jgi:hypothetical protein
MNQAKPSFYRMVSDPYQGLKSVRKIDRSMSRAGNVPGPFEQPYLAENGYGYTSIGSGYPRNAPPDFLYSSLALPCRMFCPTQTRLL